MKPRTCILLDGILAYTCVDPHVAISCHFMAVLYAALYFDAGVKELCYSLIIMDSHKNIIIVMDTKPLYKFHAECSCNEIIIIMMEI